MKLLKNASISYCCFDLKVREEMMFNCRSEGYKDWLKEGHLGGECANFSDYSQTIMSTQVQSLIQIYKEVLSMRKMEPS
jgi:hypothetical protein